MIKHHSHIECGCDLCGKTVCICTTIHNAIKILRSRGWTVGMRNACCCPKCQKNGRKPVKKETSVMTRVPSYIINAIRRRAAAAERFSIADAQISEYCKRRGIDTEYICGHVETVINHDAEFFIRDIQESFERCKNNSKKHIKE